MPIPNSFLLGWSNFCTFVITFNLAELKCQMYTQIYIRCIPKNTLFTGCIYSVKQTYKKFENFCFASIMFRNCIEMYTTLIANSYLSCSLKLSWRRYNDFSLYRPLAPWRGCYYNVFSTVLFLEKIHQFLIKEKRKNALHHTGQFYKKNSNILSLQILFSLLSAYISEEQVIQSLTFSNGLERTVVALAVEVGVPESRLGWVFWTTITLGFPPK